MSLIAGAVAVFAVPRFFESQVKAAQNDVRTLVEAVETYRLVQTDTAGDCPTTEQLRQRQIVRGEQTLVDPWRRPYRIVCHAGGIGAVSSGPDRTDGTDDDIWAGARPTP